MFRWKSKIYWLFKSAGNGTYCFVTTNGSHVSLLARFWCVFLSPLVNKNEF